MSDKARKLLTVSHRVHQWLDAFVRHLPETEQAVSEAKAALGRIQLVVSKSDPCAAPVQHGASPLAQLVKAAIESLQNEPESDEQKGTMVRNCSLQAAFIRTRRRKLNRGYAYLPGEAISHDVVRSERVGGKVVQKFVVSLGTLKRGGSPSEDRYARWRFIDNAVNRIVRSGFSPQLEGKLLAELARKTEVTAEEIEARRARHEKMLAHSWCKPSEGERQWLDKLAEAAGLAA